MRFNKILVFLTILVLYSCNKSDYDKLIQKESSRSEVLDSLIFNMHFGITKDQFFKTCMDLNRRELIMEGPVNKYAKYTLKPENDSESAVQMLFYGSFDDKKIMTGMDFLFSYDYWTAWSDDYSAEKLISPLKDTLNNWYPGNDFIPLKLKDIDKNAYVKVDANRQILIYPINTKDVVVKIEDLRNKYPTLYKK